jgi:hypothetical protein
MGEAARRFFVRHAHNLEFSNVEIATAKPGERPALWMHDVEGVDILGLEAGKSTAAYYSLHDERDLHTFGSRHFPDRIEDAVRHSRSKRKLSLAKN